MKGDIMADPEWRTVQIYLSEHGIFEVEVDTSSSDLRCTCPGFVSRGNCKHIRMVSMKMKGNGGTYPVQISNKASAEETKKASESSKEFREFVLKYGKIEVL